MPTLAGYDILQVYPNRKDGHEDELEQAQRIFDPGYGHVTANFYSTAPVVGREFDWFISGKQDAKDLRDFFAARKGRIVPFWVPTWQSDMVMTANGSSGSTSINIQAIGYTRFLFPTIARRYLYILPDTNPSAAIYRKVTAAVDNGNGTETLTLDSALGVTVTAATSLVSFLVLCRLADDKMVIRWDNSITGQAKLRFLEVPNEAP